MRRTSLLALAAGLLASLPAQAGGTTDPRCAAYGAGFVYSDSGMCVRVGGEVRADFGGTSHGGSVFGSQATVSVDARKETDMGTLRIYVSPKASVGGFN